MIEPLRYNVEAHLPYEIPRLAFCNSCFLDKHGKNRPNIAVRYCSQCPTSVGVEKNPGALQCKTCDEKIHKNPDFKDHIRQIVVVGPGLRKKIKVRGDGYNYPHTLDNISIKMKAKVYHRGRRVDRIPVTKLDYTCGMSGRCLHIQILGAKDLRVSDFLGSCDPYVVYSFCGKPLNATRVQPKTTNPIWHNETFVVPLNEYLTYPKDMPHIQKDLVRLEVFDKDYVTKSNFLGHVELTRSKLEKMALLADQQPIRIPLTMREFHGFVHFQLGFDTDYLHIRIVMADDLYKVDPTDLPNPYGKLYLTQSSLVGNTDTMKRTINPRWMKGNVFKIPILQVLFAERYVQSQIDAFHATERRSKKAKQFDELMEDFAVLPTRYALFRLELFDNKRFREDESMGNAFISISKLRKMLPAFPSTDVTSLIEYSTFVTKLVQEEQQAVINEKSRHSLTRYLSSCLKFTPSETEMMNTLSLDMNSNQEQSTKIESVAGKRRGNVFGINKNASKLDNISNSAKAPVELIDDSHKDNDDDDNDDDDNDDDDMMRKERSVNPRTHAYRAIQNVDDDVDVDVIDSHSNMIAESVETDSTESSVSLHVVDELSLKGNKRNDELSVDFMNTMIDSNNDHQTAIIDTKLLSSSIPIGSKTIVSATNDIETLTDSLDSLVVVDRPETTTSSTLPDPVVVRAFRPPPPSVTVGGVANMSNISDSKSIINNDNNSSSNIIVSAKNNNEIVTVSQLKSTPVISITKKAIIDANIPEGDSDESEDSKVDDGDIEENKTEDGVMIGDASIEIGNDDIALHRDNDDDNQIIDEDKSNNNDNDDNHSADDGEVEDEENRESDIDDGEIFDEIQEKDGESADNDNDDHEVNNGKEDNFDDSNSSGKIVASTGVSFLITSIMSTKLFVKKEIQWSDVYPVPVMMKQESIEAAQGFIVLRLILSNRGTVLLGIDEAVKQMTIGETSAVKCRYDYAYNNYSMGTTIPPRSNVIFVIKLLAINGNGYFSWPLRVLIRIRRSLKRMVMFCYENCVKKLPCMNEMRQKKKKKKRMKRSKNKKLKNNENRLFNFTELLNFIMCRKAKNSSDDRGIDSDNTDSEVDNYDSGFSGDEEDDLLDENDKNPEEYDDSSSDSEEDKNEILLEDVAARSQIKPHPRMRKHLNQSVKTGANYMWSYRPEESRVKSSVANNDYRKKKVKRKKRIDEAEEEDGYNNDDNEND